MALSRGREFERGRKHHPHPASPIKGEVFLIRRELREVDQISN
jgi:hypothetical protein